MNGATRTKGTIVRSRKVATSLRAWAVCGLRNSVPARARVITVSPAVWLAWSSVTRARPDSPAPPACV